MNIDSKIQFLKKIGCDEVGHKNQTLLDHLIGVYNILKSWDGLEKSREAGGIPFLYLYKSCLLLFCINLFFQTISLILRCLLVLSNKEKKIFFKLIN